MPCHFSCGFILCLPSVAIINGRNKLPSVWLTNNSDVSALAYILQYLCSLPFHLPSTRIFRTSNNGNVDTPIIAPLTNIKL